VSAPSESVRDAGVPIRGFLRRAVAIALLSGSALAATGRFRGALALTLGAAVSIVGALWLADLVARFRAFPGATADGFDWRFAFGSVLRYALAGAALFWTVTSMPAEVPWLLAGVTVPVLAAMADGFRGAGGREAEPRAGSRDDVNGH
jgi:hypothetical protein